jgi:hypothetical protein
VGFFLWEYNVYEPKHITMKISPTLLTRIDAYILRTIELERDIKHDELARRILSRYGVEIDIAERLKEYTPPDQPSNFLYWN